MSIIACVFLILGFPVITASADDAEWCLPANSRDNYNPPTLGTGRIGMTLSDDPFRVSQIILNNIYDKDHPFGVSKIVSGIVFAGLQLEIDGKRIESGDMGEWKQVLDLKHACLKTTFEYAGKATVEVRTYALRHLPYCGLIDVQVQARKDVSYRVTNRMQVPGDLVEAFSRFEQMRDMDTIMPLYQTHARTQVRRREVVATSVFLFPGKSPELKERQEGKTLAGVGFDGTLTAGETLAFSLGGAVCAEPDFVDPKSESERFCIAMLLQGRDAVLTGHEQAWAEIWRNDIVVEGDPQSQSDIRYALFNLYSFSRVGTRLSIPPMGLSSCGYNGHVFWDTELWMFPPLLLLEPDLARTMLDYRFDRLAKARQKATNFGFSGAMFPWESDDSGEEATPTWALTGTFEHHITADIGIACWNYYLLTRDKAWLRETGFPLLRAVADFWVSRVDRDAQGRCHIRHVVGADEFAQNVDDNAFTNGGAQVVLRMAALAAEELDLAADPRWRETADRIVIHTFEDGVTREHATYDGATIKQADANLLAYPLKVITDEKHIRADLAYYEPRIAPNGPAMGYSVLAILYARLGEPQKAWELFQRAYVPNRRGPFGTLSESAQGNNPYFCTGAGGMLQVVLFGFAGLDLTDGGLVQLKPCLPPGWKSLTIKGVGVRDETIRIDGLPK